MLRVLHSNFEKHGLERALDELLATESLTQLLATESLTPSFELEEDLKRLVLIFQRKGPINTALHLFRLFLQKFYDSHYTAGMVC